MATKPDPVESPIAEIESWLVGLPCPKDWGWGSAGDFGAIQVTHIESCICNATGLRFPGFTRECPGPPVAEGYPRLPCAETQHIDCNGIGRVAVVTLEAVMEYGIQWNFGRDSQGWWCHREFSPDGGRGRGLTPLEAATRALCVAVVADDLPLPG